MDDAIKKAEMKSWLARDVAYLCRRADRLWSEPIVRTLRDIREAQVRAVFFGGTLRSLLFARLDHGRLGRPRDIDIVVEGVTVDALRDRFQKILSRETRFGGLKLQRERWQFDVWPLKRTWAFVEDRMPNPSFASLPLTTFFNLEAIAVDVWAEPGHTRTVYAGDEQFFNGVISRTLEINREANPFPALCVVRSLLMASTLHLAIGPKLALYLARHAANISDGDLEGAQHSHYGHIRQPSPVLRGWIDHVRRMLDQPTRESITLPLLRQRMFWEHDQEGLSRLSVGVL